MVSFERLVILVRIKESARWKKCFIEQDVKWVFMFSIFESIIIVLCSVCPCADDKTTRQGCPIYSKSWNKISNFRNLLNVTRFNVSKTFLTFLIFLRQVRLNNLEKCGPRIFKEEKVNILYFNFYGSERIMIFLRTTKEKNSIRRTNRWINAAYVSKRMVK